jgi:DNA-binding NtrC family response regulator
MECPTVLVIGDGQQTQHFLAFFLHREGFRVLTAETVQEGREVFRHESVNVLMMDVRLGIRTYQSFFELDPNVKCCLISRGGYAKLDTPDGFAVVARPFCLPDIAQALWGLVTQPDAILCRP